MGPCKKEHGHNLFRSKVFLCAGGGLKLIKDFRSCLPNININHLSIGCIFGGAPPLVTLHFAWSTLHFAWSVVRVVRMYTLFVCKQMRYQTVLEDDWCNTIMLLRLGRFNQRCV